uniref:Uncharacterized protein n=1 Tax=Moniliophthora roreri TaxID=221103 RepID=A0A0W0G2G2_MONRR
MPRVLRQAEQSPLREVHATSMLPESVASRERIGASGSVPSEDSGLTRFTQRSSTNPNASSPSSLGSSEGTFSQKNAPEKGLHFFPLLIESQKRIHEASAHDAYTNSASSSTPLPSIRIPSAGNVQIVAASPTDPSPYSSRFTPSRSSTGGSELSSIVFRSPTSSNRSPRLRDTLNDSYDYNSSWFTSGGGEHDESRLLRVGTPSPTPSPSPSPLSTRASRRQQALSVPIISVACLPSTSVEVLDLPSHPMLTNLSLPDSLNNSAISLDIPPPIHRPSISRFASTVDSEVQPHQAPGSEVSEFAPQSSSSESSSLSPSSFLRAHLETPARIDAVQSPTSYVTPSSSIPANSPQSLPLSSALVPEERELNSAVEYANAVVMSSWGSDDIFIEPIATVLPQSPVIDSSVIMDVPRLHIQTDAPTGLENSESVTPVKHSRTRKGMFLRMKKLGLKMKQMLFNRPSISRQAATKKVMETEDDLDVLDICGDSNVSQILPQLELQFGGMERPAQPVPVQNRTRRQRPSLTPETYTPTNDSDPSPLDNFQQGASQSNPGRTSQASRAYTVTIEMASPDFRSQLETHARPKTVDEIKAKRPFSLSGLSSFPKSSSSSQGRSTPIPVNLNRRHRPVSALVLPSRPYPYGSSPVQNDGSFPNRIVLPLRRHSAVPLPPGLPLPSQQASSPSSLTSPVTSGPSSSSSRRTIESEAKKARRISLSALTNFAAGLRNQGTWARYAESRRNA